MGQNRSTGDRKPKIGSKRTIGCLVHLTVIRNRSSFVYELWVTMVSGGARVSSVTPITTDIEVTAIEHGPWNISLCAYETKSVSYSGLQIVSFTSFMVQSLKIRYIVVVIL